MPEAAMSEIPATILVLAMLALMAARAAPLIRTTTPGESLLEVGVPLLFRLLVQRVNVLCILAVLLLGSGVVGERWVSHGLFVFTIVAMIGILCLPARYRFTSNGLSVNRASFRPWTDFEGWDASGNVIRLHAAGRFASLRLYVTNRDRDGVLKVLKRYLKAKR